MKDSRNDLFNITSLAWSFVPFNAVRFAIQENVFLILGKDKLSPIELADRKKWKIRPTQALLSLLASFDLLEIQDEKVSLTKQSEKFLVPESDLYIGDFFLRNELLQKAYTELEELFVSDTPNKSMNTHVKESFGLNLNNEDKTIEEFGKPMMAASKIIFFDLFSKYLLDKEMSVLDIGGGIGALEQVLISNGHKGTISILENEGVANIAEKILQSDSIKFIKENWSAWIPQEEYDRVFLSHVLHEEKLEEAKKLLEKAVKSTKTGGQIIVISFMGDEGQYGQIQSVFRMNLLLEMGSDLPSLPWLNGQAQELQLRVEDVLNLEGGRVAWIATKV